MQVHGVNSVTRQYIFPASKQRLQSYPRSLVLLHTIYMQVLTYSLVSVDTEAWIAEA